jgi:hypothetical protein
MIDPPLFTFVFLGIVGAALIGTVIVNGSAPAPQGEATIYSERCTIRYVAFGVLRAGGIMPGFFSISDEGIVVKLIFTNQYKFSDIKDVRLSRNLLGSHVVIDLWRGISSIHVYPKDPEKLVKLLTDMRQV